jgi:hypothetical protein
MATLSVDGASKGSYARSTSHTRAVSSGAEPTIKEVLRQLGHIDSKLSTLHHEVMAQVNESQHSTSLARLALESELRIHEQLKEDTMSMATFNRLLVIQITLWIFVLVLLFGWWSKLHLRAW